MISGSGKGHNGQVWFIEPARWDLLVENTPRILWQDQLPNETPFAYAKLGMGRGAPQLGFRVKPDDSRLKPTPFLTFRILKTWLRPWSKSDSRTWTFYPNKGNVVAQHGFSEHFVLTIETSCNCTLMKRKRWASTGSFHRQTSKYQKAGDHFTLEAWERHDLCRSWWMQQR